MDRPPVWVTDPVTTDIVVAKPRVIGDMKAGLTSGARPKLSILPKAGLVYGTRGLEYGADKYARGNYFGPPPKALGDGQIAGALRLLGYVDAALRHLTEVQDALNRALGTGGDLARAAQSVDDLASGGFPASGLPHLAHAISSVLLGVTCAVDDALLPVDPGQPWAAAIAATKNANARVQTEALNQKDDPATERARVSSLRGKTTEEIRASQTINHEPLTRLDLPVTHPGDFR